jgi:ATP/maltotriose-dependent transcriptional regulator MalT
LLSAVTGWADVELYAALREVVEQHLMVVDGAGRGYAFRHALTRDVVYSDMLPGERGALHMAYGTALAGDPSLAGADAATAATLAYHWYAALDLPRALDSSVEAARVASAAFASAEAQFHLERALELWPRVPDAAERTGTSLDELLGQAALSAYQAGQLDRARSLVERAVAAVPPEAGSRQLAVQLERKAEILRSLGHEDSAAADYRRALELLDPHVDQALRARVLGALARVVMVAGLPEEGVGIARDAVAAAEAAGLPASLAESLVSLGTSLAYSGDIDGGLAWLRQAHELAGTLPDPQHLLRCQVNFSDVLEMAGLHDEAEAVAAAGVALAAETGFSRSIGAFLTGNRIEPLLRLGRWDEAEQLAAAELRNGPAGVFRSSIVEVLARIAVYRGDYEAAEALTRNAVIGTVINWQYSLPIATTSAEIALGRRDLAAARRVVRQALEDRTSELDGRYLLPLLCVGYQVEAELGSATASDSLFELLSSLTPETAPLGLTQVAYHAVALAERARVQAAPGDVGSWSRAAAAAEDFGDVALLAYARLRLAEAQLRSGERTAATNLLQDVQRVALQLRARPILQAVEQLAARGRLPLGSAPTEGQRNLDSYGLTERERLVLGHLAAGRSNADIAVSLFISPKTASVHVSNLMAKLGVGNRVEAAALAYRLGVTPVEPAV